MIENTCEKYPLDIFIPSENQEISYLENHKEINNYAWFTRFTQINLRPDRLIQYFITYAIETLSI